MEEKTDIRTKIKEFFSEKSKKPFLIILLGCFGILLILFSEFTPETTSEKGENTYFSMEDSEKREEAFEKRLSETVSKIKGAGKTKVMVTFEFSKEFFYAENSSEHIEENAFEKENEIVITEGENGEIPLLLRIREEKIRGVLVVCEGGGNPVVKEKIIEAVCALLDIPSTKVSVAEMAL